MDSFAGSPKGHVDRIIAFSRQDARGRAYRPLADFLSKVKQDNNNGHQTTDASSESFVYYYALYPNVPMSLNSLLDPSAFQEFDASFVSSGCGGRLIFLRGYPSPQWLSALGNLYDVRPEYWKRHLDFLSLGDAYPPESHLLPSTVGRIFQLSVGSIGSLGRWWKPGQRIKDLRRSAATDMDRYLKGLSAGRGWKPADSVVRRYILHDKEHFSIEQKVTLYLHERRNVNEWIVLVYLDCGADLATSPQGAWHNGQDQNTYFRIIPTPTDTSDLILNPEQWIYSGGPAGQHHAVRSKTGQSFSQVHLNYGTSLNSDARARDPFYLLNELFRHHASNENQTLDMVANKIETHRIGTDTDSIESTGYSITHSQLLHFQRFLEHRIEHLEDTLRFIQKRGGTLWIRPISGQLGELTDSAAMSLIEDFEDLLKRAQDLLLKIERSSSLTMNLTSIDEGKRNTELNSLLFRFTIVASFYIPWSFTASFFGMNFTELGTGVLSIWTYFVASIPIMVLSIICLSPRQLRIGLGRWQNTDLVKADKSGN